MKIKIISYEIKIVLVLMLYILLFGGGGQEARTKDIALAAQFDDEEDVAKFKVYKSYDRIHPGMELRVAVKVKIKVLWHINSNEPSEDYMIGTSIEIPSGGTFAFKEFVYPEPSEIMLGISDKPVSVYEGEVLIGGVIPVPEGLELGEHTIPIHLKYQACNDSTCLPPQSVKKEIMLTVVDEKTPIKKINKDIFTKLSEQNG
jgi:hypothetical protein